MDVKSTIVANGKMVDMEEVSHIAFPMPTAPMVNNASTVDAKPATFLGPTATITPTVGSLQDATMANVYLLIHIPIDFGFPYFLYHFLN